MKNYPDINTMKQNKELHDRSIALTKKLQKKREKEIKEVKDKNA